MVLQEPGQQGAVSVCLRGCKLQGSMKTIQPTVKTLVWLSGAGVRSLWWGLGCYNLEQFLTRLIKIARRRSDHAARFVASSLLSPCKVGAAISSASQTVHLQANPDHESTSLVSPAINNMVHRDVRHLVPVAVWVRLLQGGPGRSRFWEVAECWGEPCSPTGNSEARRTCSFNQWTQALLLRRLLHAVLHRGYFAEQSHTTSRLPWEHGSAAMRSNCRLHFCHLQCRPLENTVSSWH